jgi:3-isopropylmalate dehydrogenase
MVLSAAMMLDWLAERSGNRACADAAALLDAAVARGFAEARLRPQELGGEQGTRAYTDALLALLEDTPIPG